MIKSIIKAVTRRIVGYDGRTFQVTADFLGVAKSDVGYWCNDGHERVIPADHLIELDAVSGDIFLQEWANSRGYDLVRRKKREADCVHHVLNSLGGFARDVGDFNAEVIEAYSDNEITPAERRRIYDKAAPVKDRITQIERAIGG